MCHVLGTIDDDESVAILCTHIGGVYLFSFRQRWISIAVRFCFRPTLFRKFRRRRFSGLARIIRAYYHVQYYRNIFAQHTFILRSRASASNPSHHSSSLRLALIRSLRFLLPSPFPLLPTIRLLRRHLLHIRHNRIPNPTPHKHHPNQHHPRN